jgi:hypothetical protein
MLKSWWDRWGWPFVAVLPSLVALASTWSMRSIYCFRDAAFLWWPYKLWFRREVYGGVFPMWDPSPAFGQSALVDPSRMILFPPAMLARLIPDDALGHNLLLAAPAPVLALGAYVMLRARVSKEAAAVGAILLSLSCPFVSTLNMTTMAWTFALGPWLAAAFVLLASRPTWRRLGLAAGALALIVLAAEPVAGLGMVCVALAQALFAPRDEATSLRSRLTWLSAASAAGLLLAAVQILPIFAVLGASRRSDPAVLDFLTWSLHPLRLMETVVSMPFGNGAMLAPQYGPWMYTLNSGREPLLLSIYLGIATLTLATLGSISDRSRTVVVWLVLACGGLVLALGTYSGLIPAIIELVPSLKIFRMPQKHFLMTTLALCALAAHGWDALRTRRLTAGGVWSVAAVAIVATGAVVATYVAAPVLARLLGVPEPDLAVVMLRSALARSLLPLATFGMLAVLTCAASRAGHPRAALLQIVFVGVAAVDLVLNGIGLCPQAPTSELQAPAWVRTAIERNARAFVGDRLGDYPEPDPDAFPRLFNLPDTDYSTGNAIISARLATSPEQFGVRDSFTDDTTNVWPREFYAARDRFHVASPIERATFLHRTGVRVQVLSHPPTGQYGAPEPVESAGAIAAYYALEPVERALLAPEQSVEPNAVRAFDALFQPEFEFRRTALVDRDAPAAGTPGVAEGRAVEVLAETANAITFGVECDVESTLVVLDSYAPGWRVAVDGNEAPLLRADGLFRGVRLAPGRHTVTMQYMAPGLAAGAAISSATALALLAAAWLERRRAPAEAAR